MHYYGRLGNSAAALKGLQVNLVSEQSWMSANKLKVNPDKNEFLLTTTEQVSPCFLLVWGFFGVETNPTQSV